MYKYRCDESKRTIRFLLFQYIVEKTFDNDFAILKLATPVKFTKHVNPICLPESSNINLDSVEAMVFGWGVNYGLDITSFPAILQKVNHPV